MRMQRPSELQRAAVLDASEDTTEVVGVLEPDRPPDFCHRPLGVLQEVQRSAHARPQNV